MKKYPLSTRTDRIGGIALALAVIAALIAMLFTLRQNVTVLVLTALGVALIVTVMVMYILNVTRAACVYDPESRTLRVTGFQDRVIDLTKVAHLETIPVKSGHVTNRALAFADAWGKVVAVVPTYFLTRGGARAEPLAMEMAKDLGLEFFSTVPAWEYDGEARKVHEIEVAQQEKEDAKKRKEGRKALREAKMRARMDAIRKENKK